MQIYIQLVSKFWSLLFISRREPEEPEDATKGRDVFNEKPPADELLAVSDIGKSVTTSLPDNVVSYLCLPLKYVGNLHLHSKGLPLLCYCWGFGLPALMLMGRSIPKFFYYPLVLRQVGGIFDSSVAKDLR